MSDAQAITAGQPVLKPHANPWIIAVAVSLAAFMEVLDTSIANVAFPHIAGSLRASNDESTWVLTTYLEVGTNLATATRFPAHGFSTLPNDQRQIC